MKQTLFTPNPFTKYSFLLFPFLLFFLSNAVTAQMLTGTVQDKDNNPIADAMVILEPLDRDLSHLKMKSNDKGSVFIGQIRRGKYFTKVSKEGYALYHLNVDIQDKKKKTLWKFNGKVLSDKDLPTIIFKRGDHVQCVFTLARAEEIQKEFLLTELSSVDALISQGGHEEAKAKLESYSQSIIEDPEVYSFYGYLFNKLKDFDKAQSFLEKALELNPDQPDAHFFLGTTYAEKGMTERAVEEIQRELEITQDNQIKNKCYLYLGVLNRDMGKKDEAIAFFKKALEINPEDTDSYMDLLSLYMENKDLEAAEEIIAKLEEMGGEDATFYYNMAAEFWNKKDMDHSIKYFRKTIEIDPSFALAYKNLGLSLFSIGKIEESKKYLEKYLEFDLDPNEAADIQSILKAME